MKEMNTSLKGTISIAFPFSADKMTVVWKSAYILGNMAVFSFRTRYQQWLHGDENSQVLQNISKQSCHKTLS
jgi:hypothetical protein